MSVQIEHVATGSTWLESVKTCARESRETLLNLGVPIDDFQGFDAEIDGLPGKYQGALRGALIVATLHGEVCGTVALRQLSVTDAEMKRLYVRPSFRRAGVATLLEAAVATAAAALGYTRLKLDSLIRLSSALRFYEARGYQVCERYNDNPMDDVVFMEMQ